MAEKELLAYLIAHNLIRCVMAEASDLHETDLERLSFKGTVDAMRQYSGAIGRPAAVKCAISYGGFLVNLVRDLVPERLGRCEPRAVKRRPNLTLASTSLAKLLWKSRIATVTGKGGPAIIEALTKCHSERPLRDSATRRAKGLDV